MKKNMLRNVVIINLDVKACGIIVYSIGHLAEGYLNDGNFTNLV